MITFINGILCGATIRDYAILLKDYVDIDDVTMILESLKFPYCVVERDDRGPVMVKVYTNRVYKNGTPDAFITLTRRCDDDIPSFALVDATGCHKAFTTGIYDGYFKQRGDFADNTKSLLEFIKYYYDVTEFKCCCSSEFKKIERAELLNSLWCNNNVKFYTLDEIADAFSEHDISEMKRPGDELEFSIFYKDKPIKNGYLHLVKDPIGKYYISFVVKNKIRLFYETVESFVDAIEKGDFSENVVASYVE